MTEEAQALRRVGIVGDVHAEDETLAAALAFLIERPDLDELFCTGDLPGDSGSVDRCCALLRGAGVQTVRGNHDRWHFEEVPFRTNDYPGMEVGPEATAFLASLPPTREYATPDGLLLLCHGLGDDDLAGVYPDGENRTRESGHRLNALVEGGRYRYVVNGHTHRRMVRTIEGTTFVNAGTLHWAFGPVCAVVDFAARVAHFFDIHPDTREITPADTIPLPAPPVAR